MAGSDLMALPEGALDDVASRVGSALRGEHNGTGLRIGLACALFNGGITLRLLDGALAALAEAGTDRNDITLAWTPGAFELPLVARAFAQAGKVDAVLCFGAVVRGDTGHYDLVAGECAAGIQQVQLSTGVPVIFGVLTTETLEQALERSEPDETNKGREAALTGIEMVRLLRSGPLAH
ncbi:MAG TPA: 6,7-dimethyl-8-ribityllumazine synthase [Acidimicrobiales bacterium]|jgi:6,7-dimethyl-8-ribityllumazine synthase|nr:6,7-dimethyl-8-ribityllumazine synthase [Acidimicrobiales bacterium]